jgi:hypothetical protein
MKAPIYSQASIFHLSRLGLLVAGLTGKRFKLKKPEDQRSLILYCEGSRDPSIRKQFEAFKEANSDLEKSELLAPAPVLSSQKFSQTG